MNSKKKVFPEGLITPKLKEALGDMTVSDLKLSCIFNGKKITYRYQMSVTPGNEEAFVATSPAIQKYTKSTVSFEVEEEPPAVKTVEFIYTWKENGQIKSTKRSHDFEYDVPFRSILCHFCKELNCLGYYSPRLSIWLGDGETMPLGKEHRDMTLLDMQQKLAPNAKRCLFYANDTPLNY